MGIFVLFVMRNLVVLCVLVFVGLFAYANADDGFDYWLPNDYERPFDYWTTYWDPNVFVDPVVEPEEPFDVNELLVYTSWYDRPFIVGENSVGKLVPVGMVCLAGVVLGL